MEIAPTETPPSSSRKKLYVALGIVVGLVVVGIIVWVILRYGMGVGAPKPSPAPAASSMPLTPAPAPQFVNAAFATDTVPADRTYRIITSLTGWEVRPGPGLVYLVNSGSVDFGAVVAPTGAKLVGLHGFGQPSIAQTLTGFNVGARYKLQLRAIGRPNDQPPAQFVVYMNEDVMLPLARADSPAVTATVFGFPGTTSKELVAIEAVFVAPARTLAFRIANQQASITLVTDFRMMVAA